MSESAKGWVHLLGSITGIATFLIAFISGKRVVVALGVVAVVYFALIVVGCFYFVWATFKQRKIGAAIGLTLLGCFLAFSFATGFQKSDFESFGGLQVIGLVFLAIGVVLGISYFVSSQRKQQMKYKECPDCANRILTKAKKCQYCGHVFEETATKP